MNDGVRLFLERLGMLKYFDIFSAKGFDLESDIPHISVSDLESSLMIESKEDRAVIYAHAQKYRPSAEYLLFEWLQRHSLDHYFISFIESELTSLDSVAVLQLPNEELYDELEIVLPGHQKRFERAVANLRQEGNRDALPEIPVTQGWWGKPDCLPQAKFDFLCVTANLFACHEPNRKANIDFMVDSGSDVSTVQEKILGTLNLDLIGPVYSCGIHGGSYTNLYKAKLEVGGEQLDIEVMASNYDSLGSRIVRHFRHVIDGKRHIWLKGDYKDPLPAILPMAKPTKTSLNVAIPSSQRSSVESLPLNTTLSLPPCSSELSSSSSSKTGTEIKKSENRKVAFHENIPLSQPQSNDHLCSKDGPTFHESCHHKSNSRDTQINQPSKSGISSHDKVVDLNGITSVSSSSAQNTPWNGITSVSSSSAQNTPVNADDCDKMKNKIENQYENSDSSSPQVKKLQLQMDTEANFKSSRHKRRDPVDLSNLVSPKKVLKVNHNEIIPESLKDTGDDIDNINPLVLNPANHSISRRSLMFTSSGKIPHWKDSRMERTLCEDRDKVDSITVTDTQVEEVVHVLSQTDDEEELVEQDGNPTEDKSPENSNFWSAAGTSVTIEFDDLDESQ